MDGFYEWQQHGVPKGGKKQPFRIRRRDGQPFAFAGLWESWKGPKGGPALDQPLETATIVTTDANACAEAAPRPDAGHPGAGGL